MNNPWGGSSCPLFPGRIRILNVGFFFLFFFWGGGGGEENQRTQRKTIRGKDKDKDKNHQWTQPTCVVKTQATAFGGEHSYHCAIPTPQVTVSIKLENK